MAHLQIRLKALMKEQNLSAGKLAKRAGIPTASVKSIIQGRSKNPRSNTLQALADAFNCTIPDLLGNKALPKKKPIKLTKTSQNDVTLFKDAIAVIEQMASEKSMDLQGHESLKEQYVNYIYHYAKERAAETKSPPSIDRVFARWIVGKHIDDAKNKL